MYENIHGGNIYLDDGIEYIDFSANINPLGMPQNVKKAFIESIDKCINYPDIYCCKLRKCISEYTNVSYEHIVCSNGAADLIYRICYSLKPKKALLLSPAFSEYESALKNVDCNIVYYNLYEQYNFKLKEDIIGYIDDDIDVIFICNPNNPTGMATDKDFIIQILDKALKVDSFVVIDECFNDFIYDSDKYTVKDKIDKYNNLIVLNAFTKIFAMAGIRLGYCMTSNKNIIENLYHCGSPWAVSCIAQECGIAAMKNIDFINITKRFIEKERKILIDELEKLGFKVFEPFANYIFFKNYSNINLEDKLKQNKILIRSCKNYKGLDDTFYRIAVKTKKENNVLINTLNKIL